MKKFTMTEELSNRFFKRAILTVLFLIAGAVLALLLRLLADPQGTVLQQWVYTLGGGLLLAALAFLALRSRRSPFPAASSPWTCPLLAAGLSFYLMLMTYAFLGVWPFGENSIMLVDMHHQYAPLLSELRDMLLHGGDFTYSFHMGLGTNFIPAFAYYLSSPLNLLLVLFPESYLTEGILVITLLKNALAAGAFAACAQYLYRQRNLRIVALSVLYSMMLYMLAYSWNIMWLDVVALLPLVVLAMEHMLRTGRWVPYTLLLGLALFSNYYIGFMLCIFLVLYMAVWLFRAKRAPRQMLQGCGRFALGSLLGGGLSAALLVPTALALGRTSAAGDVFPEFATNFSLFDLFGRLFYGATPTIRSGNLPNVYCGLIVVVLLPLFFLQKRISLRRRLCFGGLLAVMLASCTINQIDLIWHGLHTPNDLPYRFSFLVCFVMLLMAGYVLTKLERVTSIQLLISLSASAIYLLLWEQLGGKHAPSPALLYTNLVLLAVYGVVLLIGVTKRLPRQVASLLLLTVLCGELLVGSAAAIHTMDTTEYFTLRGDYVHNTSTQADRLAIRRAQEWAEKDTDTFGAFSRVELLPRFTCVDTAMYHYAGITTFASSNPEQTTLFMGDMGYAINGVNSYIYNSYVAPCDSLVGIRYVVLDVRLSSHPQLELVDAIKVGDQARYIYRNELALPLGFFSDQEVLNYLGVDNAPFENQQAFLSALAGREETLYHLLPLTSDTGSVTGMDDTSFYKEADTVYSFYRADIDTEGQYFAFVDCRAADEISVSVYDQTEEETSAWSVTPYEPYIIDLGTLTPGEYAEVSISGEGAMSGNIYIARLDVPGMKRLFSTLSYGGLKITEAKGSRITGALTARKDGLLLLTVPYDKGWTVKVDGEKVTTLPVANTTLDNDDGALLAAEVPAGEHTVTLTYRAPGQIIGLLISLFSAACVALALLWPRFKKKKQ